MPQKGFFELYPSLRPALPAGAYVLAADHELVASPPDGSGDLAVDGSDFSFSIISPLFTMPPDQILSTFPPASAVGDWHQRLPQIAFKRRTLPWERNPDHTQPFDTAPPWLALVVLAEGEGTLSGDVPVSQCVTPGTTIDTDVDTSTGKYLEVRESIVNTIFPTVEDLGLLCHVRKVNLDDTELALGDDDGYLSVVVANRLPQPGPPTTPGGPLTSKRYTAYLINVQGQLRNLPKKEESESTFLFTVDMPELLQTELFAQPDSGPADVVVMKGLQAANFVNKAAGTTGAGAPSRSASARGLEQAAAGFAVGPATSAAVSASDSQLVAKWQSGVSLGDLAELGPIIKIVQLEQLYRFPVLVSWEFVCSGEGTFEQLMQGLGSAMLATEDPHLDPALAAEISPTGHISLDATTRRGDPTTIWYRGPFVPQPTARDAPAADGTLPIAHTGDQLRLVVPDGREDLSRAAAFEIGRLLALSKPGLVADLMAWRNELFGAARVQQFGIEFLDHLVAGFSTAALTGKRSLEDLIASTVMTAYAERAPSVPAANPFPAARVPEVLQQFEADQVLVGLGLQPQQVREATKQSGLLGLSGLSVTTNEMSPEPLSQSEAGLAAVRAGLDQRLDRLATEALRLADQTIEHGEVAPKSPRRRRAPDALDRLLARAARQHRQENTP